MIYVFGLKFDKKIEEQIHKFAETINKNMDLEYALAPTTTPHITLAKFEADGQLDRKLINKIKTKFKNPISVTFSGLTLLPSQEGVTWIEIAFRKSKEILDLQEKFCAMIPNIETQNSRGDYFRPHITVSKKKNMKDLNIPVLDYKILRAKDIPAYPRLSHSGKNF